MSRNPYWQMAKMAFILGAASAAGGLVVSTGYRLARKAADALVGLREDEVTEEVAVEEVRVEKSSKGA